MERSEQGSGQLSLQKQGQLLYSQVLKWWGGSLLCLILHRLGFILAYYPHAELPEGAIKAVGTQFLLGLRYDISTTVLFLFPLILFLPLYLFEENLSQRFYRTLRILKGLQFLYIGLLNLILLASSYNFGYNNRHLSWEFYAYLSSIPEFLAGIWQLEPLLLVAILVLSVGLGAFAYLLFFKSQPQPADSMKRQKSSTGRRSIIFGRRSAIFALHQFLLLAGLSIALRGGLQEVPIGVADSLRYQSSFLNNIALNGLFTISRHQSDPLREFEQFFDQQTNTRFVQQLLDDRQAFISAKYPLLRYMPPQTVQNSSLGPGNSSDNNSSSDSSGNSTAQVNIVLVILESFTAKFLAQHGGDRRVAPNFQRLISQGRYFERFFAAGARSSKGLFAIFSGLPDRAGKTIMRSPQLHNRMGGLASLLRQKGYRTDFLYGGDLNFDQLDNALRAFGFEETVGKADLAALGGYKRGKHAWGYDDEHIFDLALKRMDRSRQPFFMTVYTLNTHHPYSIPDSSYQVFDKSSPNSSFLNSYHYTDHALGEFMRRITQRAYFSNTVFLFVADHTDHSIHNKLSLAESHHLPFLIYAPGRISAEIISTTGSQLDLLPTILALAGGDSLYAAMGNNLNSSNLNSNGEKSKGNRGFAFSAESYSGLPILFWSEAGLVYRTNSFYRTDNRMNDETNDGSHNKTHDRSHNGSYNRSYNKSKQQSQQERRSLGRERGERSDRLGLLADMQNRGKELEMSSLSPQYASLIEDYREKLLHFHQFARYLEKNNRIWPQKAELQAIERSQR